MPTNPVNPLQDFIPADVLRVQVDTSELPNQFLNPIGEYGIWGWSTENISNTALGWNAIDSRVTNYYSHTSTTFTLLVNSGGIPAWMVAGSTVYLEGGHPEIADRYYTVNSVTGMAAGAFRFEVNAPAGANMSLVDPNWPTEVYDFINTTSDVPSYLKFSASYFETLVSQPAYMVTKLMPIQAGQWAGASLNTLSITANHTLRFSFEWRDEDGVLLSTSTTTGALSGTGAHYLDPRQAPANTAFMRFKVQMYNGTGTTNPAAGARLWFSETVVTKAATSAALQTTRTNLITNPSFEVNTAGWSNEYLAGPGPAPTRVASGGVQGSAYVHVDHLGEYGLYNTGMANLTVGETYTLSFWAKSPDSVSIVPWKGTTPFYGASSALTTTWKRYSWTFTAVDTGVAIHDTSPSGSVNADVHVDGVLLEKTDILKPYLDGSLTDTATKNYSWTGTAHASTSTLVEPTYTYTDPELNFSDVLGRSSGLSINREELDVGTLTVSAKDSSLDPSKAELIRPGRKIRAQVLTGGSWETLYLGSISNAKVNYDLLDKDPNRRSIVEITATNGVQTLANSRQPDGVAILDDLGPALYAVNLPALVNGLIATPEYASANPITYTNESASTLDVVAIARDSESGYAWVTRDNILTAWSADQIPTTVAQTFGEADYNTDFNVDYDTETCINSVTVKALRITGSGDTQETEEWTFGPYRDTNSISEWGTYSAEFTVSVPIGAVLSASYFQPFANAILAANATPRLRVNSLTFPVKDEATLARTLIDLYDLVEITNAEAAITAEQMRVTGISHTITPDRWLVTLSFAHEGSVATPQLTPPLASTMTTDLDQPASGSLTDHGFTMSSGWSLGTNYAVKVGHVVHIYFNVTRTGATLTAGATGNLGNVTVATFGDDLDPILPAVLGGGLTGGIGGLVVGDNGAGAGTVVLAYLAPNVDWPSGESRSFGGVYIAKTYGWN